MGRQTIEKQRDAFATKAMRIRLERGINQAEISMLLGYKSNEYARIESGFRPMRYQLVPNLCEILGVPPNTFDDVVPKPTKEKTNPEEAKGDKIFDRLEEIREQVLGMNVVDFCKVIETTPPNYQNLRVAHKAVAKYMRKLVRKYCLQDPRVSYSYLIEGKLSPELNLTETVNELKAQLQQARERIRDLERINKAQVERINDLEIIKSLASKIYVGTY